MSASVYPTQRTWSATLGHAGRIEQVGTPGEIYERPRTRFVADFIGEINLFDGAWKDGRFVLDGRGVLPAPAGNGRNGNGTLAVRPEKVALAGVKGGILRGRIDTANFLGDHTLYRILTADSRPILAKEPNVGDRPVRTIGDAVGLTWRADDAIVLES